MFPLFQGYRKHSKSMGGVHALKGIFAGNKGLLCKLKREHLACHLLRNEDVMPPVPLGSYVHILYLCSC